MSTAVLACEKCGAALGDEDVNPCPDCNFDRNIGRKVGERFIVTEALGGGGMGSIYRGRDERLGEDVAIKFLRRSLLRDPVLRERFRREALSLAKLRHPGIVTVLDFGEAGTDLYTVLELVRGSTLSDLIGEQQSLSLLRAAPIFDQILAALEVCHDSGVIHRDIKPSNIMVTTVNGVDHVKLIDFGLAHVAIQRGADGQQSSLQTKLTETGTVHGTPHYMAPEQCRGEEVSAATDIYSTGIVFYESLSGVPPFRGHDAATYMAQHLFVDPPPLSQLAPDISAGISATIHRALAKKEDTRPSARELRQTLISAFKGTDPETLAANAAVERRRVGGLTRADRALTKPQTPPVPIRQATADEEPQHRVVAWMNNDERTAKLLGAIGTSGLTCTISPNASSPNLESADAVILSATQLERVGVLRAADPDMIVIVVDVVGPDGTTNAIRAGASDMLLQGASEADLVPKLKRLLKRRRR
jgi:eukaryotic-like serine/threonine-protein kinase